MPAQWTGEVVGKMHANRITAKALADHLGYHPKYLSAILNGHKTPKSAEETVKAALDDLVSIISGAEPKQ